MQPLAGIPHLPAPGSDVIRWADRLALTLFALGLAGFADALPAGVLHGLKVAAVAVVAQAVWGMARNLCTDASRLSLMAVATCLVLLVPSAWAQVVVIALAALVGLVMFKPAQTLAHEPLPIGINRGAGAGWLMVFLALLLGLPLLSELWPSQALNVFDAFYRAGSLVFGGGHVMLPLLQAEVVPNGWVSNATFVAGYGATQAVPGPLFTFAAFLGASMPAPLSGWLGSLLCLVAIFLPSFLLVFAALPFWEQLRTNVRMQAAMQGVNAAVVGLLLAALYRPVWTSAIVQPSDFGLALLALVALLFWRLPAWLVVIGCGVVSGLFLS